MSNERPSRPEQRFSRYSRASYDEFTAAPSEADLSLAELTERALRRERAPEPAIAAAPPLPTFDQIPRRGIDQPPPPSGMDFWNEEDAEPQQSNGRGMHPLGDSLAARLNGHPQPAAPEQAVQMPPVSIPQDIDEYEPEPPAKSTREERKAEAEIKARRREARKEKTRPALDAVKSTSRMLRSKTGPLLTRSGLWLAHNLRRREIRRRFSRLLAFGHANLTDRKTEQLFFVPTRMAERFDPAPDQGIHYDGPVPVKAFEWVMSFMPDDLREFAFIDVRAGLGRTSLLAARHNFKRIVAYEYEPKLFDDLQMNIAQYPRSQMVCRNIDAYRGDVDGIVLPDQPTIVYFSNAWREPMIAGVVNYISDTYRQSPRRIYIILENTAADTAIEQSNIFDPLEPPIAERLKLRLLSPIDFKVYRSLA